MTVTIKRIRMQEENFEKEVQKKNGGVVIHSFGPCLAKSGGAVTKEKRKKAPDLVAPALFNIDWSYDCVAKCYRVKSSP